MIAPFIDHSVKTDETGRRLCSHGLSPAGYDISLTAIYEVDSNRILNPKDKGESGDLNKLPSHKNTSGDYVVLNPGRHFLGESLEYFTIPRNISGTLLIKSTYGRLGLILIESVIDPGFNGNLTVSIFNGASCPVMVYLNEGFAQFVCHDTGECEVDYAEKGGAFQCTTSATQKAKS